MPERDPRIVEEFRRRQRRQYAVAGTVFAACGLLIYAGQVQPNPLGLAPRVAQGGAFFVVVCALLSSLRNWRCPACQRYLGKTWVLRFCPGCGVPLA